MVQQFPQMRLDTQRPDRAPNFSFRGLKALPVIVWFLRSRRRNQRLSHTYSSFNAQSLQACERGTKEKRPVRSNLFAKFQSHPRQIL